MTTNLGSVEFAVAANTEALKSAAKTLKSFERSVKRLESVVKRQASQSSRSFKKVAASSKNSADAMRRQRKAVDQMLAKLNRLNTEIIENVKDQEKANRLVRENTAAFNRLANAMNQGRLKTADFSNVLVKNNAVLDRNRQEMLRAIRTQTLLGRLTSKLRIRTKRYNKEAKQQGTFLRNLGSSAIFALGPLSGVGARIAAFSAISGRVGPIMATIAATLAGLTTGAVALGVGTVKTAVSMQRLRATLRAVSDDASEVEQDVKFLIKQSIRLGIDVSKTAGQFAKLKAATRGTVLQGQATKDIFLAMAQAARVLGLSQEDLTGIMTALVQMISKGRVTAEELRGQIGERLPGTMRLAAKAIGVTTEEFNRLLNAGKIFPEQFIPEFSRVLREAFGKDVPQATNTLESAFNSLKAKMVELFDVIERRFGIAEKLKEFINFLIEKAGKAEEFIGFKPVKVTAEQLRSTLSSLESDIEFTNRAIEAAKNQQRNLEQFRRDVRELLKEKRELQSQISFSGALSGKNIKIQQKIKDINHDLAVLQRSILQASTNLQNAFEVENVGNFDEFISAMENKLASLIDRANQTRAALNSIASDELLKEEGKRLRPLAREFARRQEAARQRFLNFRRGQSAAQDIVKDQINQRARELNILKLKLQGNREEAEFLDKFGDVKDKLERAFKKFASSREGTASGIRGFRLETMKALLTMKGLEKAIADANFKLRQQEEFTSSLQSAFEDVGDSIIKAFTEGGNAAERFRSIVKRVIDDILEQILKLSIFNPLENALFGLSGDKKKPTIASVGSTLFGFIGGLFGGGGASIGGTASATASSAIRHASLASSLASKSASLASTGPLFPFAKGGRPPVGRPSIVGEKGPELFIPDTAGTIIPNDKIGGITINQQFDFRGASLEAVSLLRREATRIRNETIAAIDMRDARGITAARRRATGR